MSSPAAAVALGIRLQDVVSRAQVDLGAASVPRSRRVALEVMASILATPVSWVSLHRDEVITVESNLRVRVAVEKIIAGAPFAYAVGSASFRHLTLAVDERVLIPRPETEVLVGEILDRMTTLFAPGESWGTAIDIGTGSGAIALSLASEGCFNRVIATDVSEDALSLARDNARSASASTPCKVEFRAGSLLAPLANEQATLLVSNPPYIAYSEIDSLPVSVRDWEPSLALFSGSDGMAATAEIVRQGGSHLVGGGLLALEVDERRASLVAELVMAQGCYRDIAVRLDLTGRERFVFASRI